MAVRLRGHTGEKLAIKAAFLQNTREQTVPAGGFHFALAAVAGGRVLALLPVAVMLVVVGWVLYYGGYSQGANGRSLGLALPMLPSAMGHPIVWVSGPDR